MAYRKNNVMQVSIDDSFNQLSPRTQRIVMNSWAKPFADYVFPAINEDRFKALYSDNPSSRPSTPVNYVIGALLIKELLGLTDEETVETVCCDVRAQYALHSTSLEEQPISDRTFSRFRERLYNYEMETGEDLLADEMKALAKVFADHLKLDNSLRRMDSLMVASHCKSMSRLEIIYTTVANCATLMQELGCEDRIPGDMRHYLEKDDVNQVIYYAKGEDVEPRLQKVIDDAVTMKELMSDDSWHDFSQYQLLIRVIREQTETGDDERHHPTGTGNIRSTSLQNPSDPDATYRKKAGKDNKGYVGNIEETIGENGKSLITGFAFEQNTHSDAEYTREYIAENQGGTVIADGAYGSTELQAEAEEKDIRLITTSLTGKEPAEIAAEFVLSDDGRTLISCPAGEAPVSTSYYEKTEMIRAVFDQHTCENCKNKDHCIVKLLKTKSVVMISAKMVQRAAYRKKLGTEEYKELTKKRNAVEGIMSTLRRRYRVDEIPVFGRIRTKMFFNLKIGAFNIVKLIKHMPDGTCETAFV